MLSWPGRLWLASHYEAHLAVTRKQSLVFRAEVNIAAMVGRYLDTNNSQCFNRNVFRFLNKPVELERFRQYDPLRSYF